jgi:ribokinase
MFWKKKKNNPPLQELRRDKVDFLAIGDIVTDAFIELDKDQAWIETDNPEKNKELCMKFGDKLPYKDVVVVPGVGNSSNAAVSASRLGLSSASYTNVGEDAFGEEQMQAVKDAGVITDFVKINEGEKSNYHYVLRYGPERTILVRHTNWNYKMPELKNPPKFIYLSSLAENSLEFHHEIADYVKANPETKLILQPGTFQMKLGYEKLKDLYEASYMFFANKEEYQRILETKEDDVIKLLELMNQKGVAIPILTDGPNGAYALQEGSVWKSPMYPDPKPPVDRTGAGDSFASTVTCALILGKPLEEALLWGPVNSMSVVQHIGAQEGLLPKEKLEEYLKNAPEDYKIEKVK